MKRVVGILPKTVVGWLGTAVAVFWALQFVGTVIPVSIWMDVRRVEVVEPVYEGETIRLIIDRTINRDFDGEFSVTVRNSSTNVVVCTGFGNLRYRTTAMLPDPVTLQWWVNSGQPCGNLPVGSYEMVTEWVVKWSPVRSINPRIEVDTLFSVLPRKQEPEGISMEMQLDTLQRQVQEISRALETNK